MLNIRRNVVFSLVELVTNLLLVFLTYRVILAHGGVALLGVWATLYAWLSIIRLGDLGAGGAVTRFVAGLDMATDRSRIAGYIHTAAISSFAMCLALVLLLGGPFLLWLPQVVGGEYAEVAAATLPLMLVGLLANNAATVVLSSLIATHQGWQRSLVSIGGNLVQLGLAVLLVPLQGLVGFAEAQLVQYVGTAIVGWVLVCRVLGRWELPWRFRLPVLREMLGFTLTLQFAGIVNGLWEPVSKILVSLFAGMYVQGLYEAAFKTVFLARNIAVQAATATVPALTRFVQTDAARARDFYLLTHRRVVALLAVTMGGSVLGAPAVSLFWFGGIDRTYLGFVAVLVVGVTASGWCTPAYLVGLATGRLRGNIVATGTSLMVLALFGTLMGLLGWPLMIVGVVSVTMLVSSALIVAINEPMIGITRRRWRFRPVAAASSTPASDGRTTQVGGRSMRDGESVQTGATL